VVPGGAGVVGSELGLADPAHAGQQLGQHTFKPTDPVSKEIAQYEEDTSAAGVLGAITPHPSGADTVEATFLRIADDMSQGKTKVADAVKQFFSEAKAALAA
ncbi:sugar ABC transporter substrate-binding protein, partial [Streptomyces sp. NPDC052015]